MKSLRSVLFAAVLLAATPALAQWQTPNHTVPVGRGAGVTGFGSVPVAGTTAGDVLTSNGPSADPSFQALSSVATVPRGGTGLSAASGTSLPLWSTGVTTGPLAYRAITGADLPNPSVSTLGAVFSSAAVANQFVTAINNDGTISRAAATASAIASPFTVGGVQYGGNITSGANYNIVYGPDTRNAVQIGDAADKRTYLKNDNGVTFADNGGGTTFGTVTSAGGNFSMAATSIKCNTTGGAAQSTDCTPAQIRTLTEQGTVLLAVLTASASPNLSDTTHITAAFDDYMITFNNIVPVTNSVGFNCLYHSGGVFPATTYLNNAGASTTFADLTSGSSTVPNTAGGGVTGTMYLRNVNSTTTNKFFDGRTYSLLAAGGIGANNPVAVWNGAQTAIDGIQCQFSSGNISTGNIKIYGLRSAL